MTGISASSLSQQREWKNILAEIKTKKIVIFGAGSNGEVLLKMLPYQVSYFVDNDQAKWGRSFNGAVVHNPAILKTEQEVTAVLIGGYAYEEMIKQLNLMELGGNIEIVNVYKPLQKMIAKNSFITRSEEFIKYLDKIPASILPPGPLDHEAGNGKISVLVNSFLFAHTPWYLMVIAIMLKLKHQDVHIIWDDVEGYDDLFYDWNGATHIQNEIIGDILKRVSDKFDIQIIKITDIQDGDLDKEDRPHLNRLAQLNTVWKYRTAVVEDHLQEYCNNCFIVLERNLKKIKRLVNSFRSDRIICFTGLHGKQGLYAWAAQKKNIQVCSFDENTIGLALATQGAVSHQMDIKQIIERNMINEELLAKFISFSKDHFFKRIRAVNNHADGVYQIAKYSKGNGYPNIDVIIPLNISWDAAALGKNRFFDSVGQWAQETVGYILANTTATVAVRQHPAEGKFTSGKDMQSMLEKEFGGHPRFRYIASTDQVNTYNLIENCKLVLPHTSTTGVEAALLNKPVIVASDVYYSDMPFVQQAVSKEDYFAKIANCLQNPVYQTNDRSIDKAWLCYGLLMFNSIKTGFKFSSYDLWMNRPFAELMNSHDVEKIMKTFAFGKPIAITQIEDFFASGDSTCG